ncbi:MAG: DNA gyrase subunit A [Candidatus Firestonebacteria bacterium]|nr:DNA gyrase subunit A [Candidatus Firestonebacteria bacterium]
MDAQETPKITSILVEEEMKHSYIDYSMSVIVGRALPDVRDGLKPVHRRILYGMHSMGLHHNRPYRKSAKIVGEVMGNYHPHGDAAIYETMVRMAQDFSYRYPIVDGQGNFGSVDGDPAAAMRYTEARLASISEELLADIEKDTVPFVPNYDDSLTEPSLLPVKFPNLLVNGSSGIAVGMATNIPPHNLSEIIDGTLALIENPEIKIEELMKYVKGPDFPTAAYILGREGIRDAYKTGRGSIKMQAKAKVEQMKNGKERLVITELPYQVNKAVLIENIADLVRNKKIEGISDLRDESDRDGMRIVIELGRNENSQVILNNLFKYTSLRTSFGVNMLALVDGKPLTLNLKQILEYFVSHRREVILRRTRYELDRAEKRAHILEGLKIALKFLDKIIRLIRASATVDIAREELIKQFGLSILQAQAILDMRLQQLTNLESKKIEDEYLELIKTIERLKSILASARKVLEIIAEELQGVKKKFGDARRSEIIGAQVDLSMEDLIAEEDMVITISHQGYIKRLPVSTYKAQRRGGKGIAAMGTKEDDFVEHLFIATTHQYILLFTSLGRMYWLKVYEIPEASRTAKGKAIVNLIRLQSSETVEAMIPVKEFSENRFLVMATEKGLIKRTRLTAFANPRAGGIIALTLMTGDRLLGVAETTEDTDIILATRLGKAIRFNTGEIREIGRTGKGVRGIRLRPKDKLVGMEVLTNADSLLTVTTKGFGKRTVLKEYRAQSRGGLGMINIKTTERNGEVVSVKAVSDMDELMIITTSGNIIRMELKNFKAVGRNAQGVRMIKVDEKDFVGGVARVVTKDEE